MTSQLVIFRVFLFIFFVPLTLNLIFFPVNQLIKKFLSYCALPKLYDPMKVAWLWLAINSHIFSMINKFCDLKFKD